MIDSVGPIRSKGILLQFPFQVPRKICRTSGLPEDWEYDSNHDIVASNDRLAEILDSLGCVCEWAVQGAPPAESNMVANYLTAALENCARIKLLVDERDNSF